MLLLLACTSKEALPTCDLSPPEPGTLHADGTVLRDEHGREVILRGVNAGGRSKFAPYMPFDFGDDFEGALAAYLDRAEAWGLSALRVPFSWAAMEPQRGVDDEAWLARYDALLDAAWDRGMWTIVDAHQDIYSEVYCGDGFPGWTVQDPPEPRHDCEDWFMAYVTGDARVDAAFDAFWADSSGVRTDFGAMWDRMAARHRDRPGVIGYEILNEPYEGTADSDTFAATTLTDFYSELAARIQAGDPDALVFFDSTGFDAISATTSLQRPEGENLVFAPHFYDPAVFAGASTFSSDIGASLAQWQAVGEGWDMPVLLGEYGIEPGAAVAEEYAREHQDALDDLHLHGTWWEYSVAEEAWNFEDLSVVEADGSENPVLTDQLARPYPRAIAGSDATWTWDGRELRMTYSPEGGVTEIRWPERLGAPSLSVTGACFDVAEGAVYLEGTGAEVEVVVTRGDKR